MYKRQKQLTPHPWDALSEDLKVGDIVKGKVVVIADYGAFVEIAPGVEGLIHVSEMSWTQHLHSAQDFILSLIHISICAAPMVFGGLGLLEGKKATCYPGFEGELRGAKVTDKSVVIDGNITTGKGPGLVFDFALALVEQIAGKETRKEVQSGLLL